MGPHSSLPTGWSLQLIAFRMKEISSKYPGVQGGVLCLNFCQGKLALQQGYGGVGIPDRTFCIALVVLVLTM